MNYINEEYCNMLLILNQQNNQADSTTKYAKYYFYKRHPNVIRRITK